MDHPENWLIRRALPADIDELVMLAGLCSSMPWSRDSLLRDLVENAAAVYWVVVSPASRVIGFIACWTALDEADIVNLAVSPAWRRRGLALRLLQYLLEQLAETGIRRVSLDVREHNGAALALYHAYGFRVVGLRKGYYPDNGENAIIMTRYIGQNDEYNVQ